MYPCTQDIVVTLQEAIWIAPPPNPLWIRRLLADSAKLNGCAWKVIMDLPLTKTHLSSNFLTLFFLFWFLLDPLEMLGSPSQLSSVCFIYYSSLMPSFLRAFPL